MESQSISKGKKAKSTYNRMGKKQAPFWEGEDVLVFSGKINNSSINSRNLTQFFGIIPQWGYNGCMKEGGRDVQAHKEESRDLGRGLVNSTRRHAIHGTKKGNAKWMTWQLTLAGTITPSLTSTIGPCFWSPTVSNSKCDHLQLHFTAMYESFYHKEVIRVT